MKKILVQIFIIINTILILSSCSDEKFDLIDNGKTNHFEQIDRFQSQYFAATNWKVKSTDGYLFSATMIDNYSLVVINRSNELVFIKDGIEEWSVKLKKDNIVSSKPVSIGNTILVMYLDGVAELYDLKGKLKWNYKINFNRKATIPIEPIVIKDKSSAENYIIGNTEGNITLLNKNGKMKWEINTSGIIYKTLVSDKNNNIYINSQKYLDNSQDTLFVIDINGKIKKQISFDNENIVRNPIISNSRLYFTTSIYKNTFEFAKLYSYDLEFNQVYQKELSMLPRHLSVNKSKEDVYLVGYNSGLGSNLNNGVFCYDKTGKEKWHIYYEYSIPHPVLVSQNEVCFTGSNQKTIGLFYLDNENGTNVTNVSLGSLPDFNLTPTVGIDGNLIYTCIYNNQYITVDGTPLDKMINYKFN